ncbi:phosphotransferase family protein [Xylaria digitata]|nr:phosphotransferase family protein [Xylaria digitata]
MPPKPRFLCMDKDDLVWQKLDEAVDEWDISIRTKETYRAVGNLILKYKEGQAELMHPAVKGGYNVVYRLEYKDGTSAVMRVPIRVRYEVATMRYVAANTTIPVPHVYHYGTAADNPIGLGPFIIMDYIEHHQNMSRELLDPKRGIDERPILDPDIGEEKLEFFMLPSQTYASADEWYRVLADMHIAQLVLQHNDTVENVDDAHDKYVARQLFRKLAAERRLTPELESDGGFTLFSEDLRPANILPDKDLRVVGVIDWEFAYAAPTQFSFDPPWWLLLEEPEDRPSGFRAWMEAYEPRLRTFLCVLEAEEKKMATANIAEKVGRMSLAADGKTEERTWMRNYAARKSWAFDFIWWKFLDESYFGPNENQDCQARLALLSEPQREVMEAFVACKMEESRNPGIIEWGDKQAADRLAKLLV